MFLTHENIASQLAVANAELNLDKASQILELTLELQVLSTAEKITESTYTLAMGIVDRINSLAGVDVIDTETFSMEGVMDYAEKAKDLGIAIYTKICELLHKLWQWLVAKYKNIRDRLSGGKEKTTSALVEFEKMAGLSDDIVKKRGLEFGKRLSEEQITLLNLHNEQVLLTHEGVIISKADAYNDLSQLIQKRLRNKMSFFNVADATGKVTGIESQTSLLLSFVDDLRKVNLIDPIRTYINQVADVTNAEQFEKVVAERVQGPTKAFDEAVSVLELRRIGATNMYTSKHKLGYDRVCPFFTLEHCGKVPYVKFAFSADRNKFVEPIVKPSLKYTFDRITMEDLKAFVQCISKIQDKVEALNTDLEAMLKLVEKISESKGKFYSQIVANLTAAMPETREAALRQLIVEVNRFAKMIPDVIRVRQLPAETLGNQAIAILSLVESVVAINETFNKKAAT